MKTVLVVSMGIVGCTNVVDPVEEAVGESSQSLIAYSEPCVGTTPDFHHVMIWQNTNYTGPCRQLGIGHYPTATNFGLPDNSISGIRVGASVRMRVFRDGTFAGADFHTYFGGTPGDLLTWDNSISSIRITPIARENCNVLQEGEIALFNDENFSAAHDCVVLPAGSYPTPQDMGIANDSISSIRNNSSHRFVLRFDAWFGPPGLGVDIGPYESSTGWGSDGFLTQNINNHGSSLEMLP